MQGNIEYLHRFPFIFWHSRDFVEILYLLFQILDVLAQIFGDFLEIHPDFPKFNKPFDQNKS